MSEIDTAKATAIKALNAAMETEVGRKIVISKMIALTEDNRRLRRKVADDRIAVHALNELSLHLTRFLNHNLTVLQQNEIPMDAESTKKMNSLNAYRCENFEDPMILRIQSILADTEGDDLLLFDLIGKQPEEKTNA